jgi:predicted flap endonuclease-1-like 5' DNA nuclease
MLYVAGEIIVWMALAFLLGVAVGWFVWGVRSRRAASAPAVTTAAAASNEIESVTVRPTMKPMTAVSDTAEQVPVTPPAGQPAVVVLPAGVTKVGEASSSRPAGAAEPSARGPAGPASSSTSVDSEPAAPAGRGPSTSAGAGETPPVASDEPAIALEELDVSPPTTVAEPPADREALADLAADEPAWGSDPTPAAGQPAVAPVEAADEAPATATSGAAAAGAGAAAAGAGAAAAGAGTAPEGAAGVAAVPARRTPDDLQVVEGIGPRIEVILKDAGIGTWQELAESSPDRLRMLLDLAGDQYRVHDPASWPHQAELAVAGRWDELQSLQATILRAD